MKYGETLRQRSIPAWSHHNIDYDDIKSFIKESTTPGHGKTVAVPGRTDDKLTAFENDLFRILAEQHSRIGLFVKSKLSEIQRRLGDSKKRLQQLAARRTTVADGRIPVGRLERYSRLENDVIKVGDEIKSLARFIAAQRTAFQKLLKKYKKWTKSTGLETRFRYEILGDPKSFTKLDLGFMLDDYSATRQSIRTLYESFLQQSTGPQRQPASSAPTPGSSSIRQLQDAVQTGSKVTFDTSVTTVPLGQNGVFASYFVHPENVVELQMLLLQYTRYYLSRSRSNSIATPVSSEPQTTSFGCKEIDVADYHILAADTLSRFAQEQSALTVHDREHLPGSFPQRAKASVRWNNTEDALACLRSRSGRTKTAYLKRKHIDAFFDNKADFIPKQEVTFADDLEKVDDLRKELLADQVEPLFHFSSSRSRLVGLDDGPEGMVLATLDTGIMIGKSSTASSKDKSNFPFALLLVRQEGTPKSDLVSVLDDSYLVERVRGFSIEYHSVWQTHQPGNIPPPYWLPILKRDIRKLPPPAMKRTSTAEGSGSGSRSGASPSVGTTDSTTAVEAESYNDPPSQLEQPPLRSFRKKKRRNYPPAEIVPQQRYWSEYDHPEDGEDGEAFYILVDPNENNPFDKFFDRVGALFRKKEAEEDPLLHSPDSPRDDETSSDEEAGETRIKRSRRGFGTFTSSTTPHTNYQSHQETHTSLGPFGSTCFAASLAILVIAYILRTTGRHKYIREVHWGVVFAIICSLAFVLIGFMSVIRGGANKDRHPTLVGWAICTVVLLVDIIGSGGLLASMFG